MGRKSDPRSNIRSTMIDDPKPKLLSELLNNVETEDERAWLYLPSDEEWGPESRALVLESIEVPPEDEDDPEAGISPIAKELCMEQVLPIGVVQDVIANLKGQRSAPNSNEMFNALVHYHEHDAFIDLKRAEGT